MHDVRRGLLFTAYTVTCYSLGALVHAISVERRARRLTLSKRDAAQAGLTLHTP